MAAPDSPSPLPSVRAAVGLVEVEVGVLGRVVIGAVVEVEEEEGGRTVVEPVEALPLVVVDVGVVGFELEVGEVLPHAALAGVVPVVVVVVVARGGENRDGAGGVVEFAGVVAPELVPVDLLAPHFGEVAGDEDEVRRAADDFDDVGGVARRLVYQVAPL